MIQMYLPATREVTKKATADSDLYGVQFEVLTPVALINTPYSVYTDSLIKSVKKGAYAQEYKPIRDASGNKL